MSNVRLGVNQMKYIQALSFITYAKPELLCGSTEWRYFSDILYLF